MNPQRRFPGLVCLLALAIPLLAGPVDAEVGCVHVASGPSDGYIFSIQEDPNPIPSLWTPVATDVSIVRVVLNPDGAARGDGEPRMIDHPLTGTPIVVWSRNANPGYDVVVSRFVDGAWTEPVIVVGTPEDELDPFVTVDPADGSVHVVYWVADGTPSPTMRVWHVQAPADLSLWSAPTAVSGAGELAARPSAVFHDGKLRVVYELQIGDWPPYHVAMASLVGGWLPEGIVGASYYDGPIWPEVYSSGNVLWVEWIDDVDSMAWIEQALGQPWGPLGSEPYTTLEDRDFFARGRIRSQALD